MRVHHRSQKPEDNELQLATLLRAGLRSSIQTLQTLPLCASGTLKTPFPPSRPQVLGLELFGFEILAIARQLPHPSAFPFLEQQDLAELLQRQRSPALLARETAICHGRHLFLDHDLALVPSMWLLRARRVNMRQFV